LLAILADLVEWSKHGPPGKGIPGAELFCPGGCESARDLKGEPGAPKAWHEDIKYNPDTLASLTA
jgi:hypothetical protein